MLRRTVLTVFRLIGLIENEILTDILQSPIGRNKRLFKGVLPEKSDCVFTKPTVKMLCFNRLNFTVEQKTSTDGGSG